MTLLHCNEDLLKLSGVFFLFTISFQSLLLYLLIVASFIISFLLVCWILLFQFESVRNKSATAIANITNYKRTLNPFPLHFLYFCKIALFILKVLKIKFGNLYENKIPLDIISYFFDNNRKQNKTKNKQKKLQNIINTMHYYKSIIANKRNKYFIILDPNIFLNNTFCYSAYAEVKDITANCYEFMSTNNFHW